MNLHQFRVLNAVLQLPQQFTTSDLVRESGVSDEVVRKTYQRYERFFTTVAMGKPKVRSLTSAGRKELLQELRQSQSRLPPPPAAHGPEGEPLGLAGAERVLYELIPASDAASRTPLLREARSHLELADQEREQADEPTQNVTVEVRLDAVRRMLGYVEVLHRAKQQLENRAPDADLSSVDALATALINAAAAQKFSRQPNSRSMCTGLLDLLALRARAPVETKHIARAFLELTKEPAWCKAIGIPDVFWTPQEETVLGTRFRDEDVVVVPNEPFTICVDRWDKIENGDGLVRATAAFLRIAFNNKIATRHLDPWSKSIQDSARLAAYPLALWLAASWWRLRWEPLPWGPPGESWKRAHEIASAGYGFVWPRLSLSSNGECIRGFCRATAGVPTELAEEAPQYLANFDESVPAADFERVADSFIKQVLDRLADVGQTELATIWQQLTVERSDPGLTAYRRLEAMLGFNRDEAPEQVLQDLTDLLPEAGSSSVDELAWASSGRDSVDLLTKTAGLARSSEGVRGRIALPSSALNCPVQVTGEFPWARGHRLALACRKYAGFGWKPITDAALADTLSLVPAELSDEARAPAQALQLGLAVRNHDTSEDKFLFHRLGRYTRRFEAAKFLADSLLAHSSDRWLLETKAGTARQQAQRAFAAEFLAPIEPLRDFLGGDHSDEKLEEASVHWGLTSNAVGRHLELNSKEAASNATRGDLGLSTLEFAQ